MNINSFIDSLLKKTLWLWLPFYAFFHLIQEFGETRKK